MPNFIDERVVRSGGCTPFGQTIVIRPPEYWPDLAFAALMRAADIIVLADTFQYSRQSLQNRTRVRNPDGWQWISVPLKGGQHGRSQASTCIRQVPGWRKRHWKAIAFNYGQSPYFDHYGEAIRELYKREWEYLGALNVATIRLIFRWMGFSATLLSATELEGCPDNMEAIMAFWPKSELLAPAEIHEPCAARRLYFSQPDYRQTFVGFEPGMTVLDLICNYGPESADILHKGTCIELIDRQINGHD